MDIVRLQGNYETRYKSHEWAKDTTRNELINGTYFLDSHVKVF